MKDLVPGYQGAEKNLFGKINLSLYGGEMICLMGPNGSGKSTLLRTVAGIQDPLSGEILFHDNDGKTDASRIAIVLTDVVKVSNMTVTELITFGRYPYLNWNIHLLPGDREIVEHAIRVVGIGDLAQRKIDELSDGQRQMVQIARAIAQDTHVLALDEPTSHLDLGNRIKIMRFLRGLSRSTGKAILVATHELDLALQTADKLWLADGGEIISGVPEDLMLSGEIGRIFQVGGYDILTGQMHYDVTGGTAVKLTGGNAASYKWTKNALERNGIRVDSQGTIEIIISQSPLAWQLDGREHLSIAALLKDFKSI